ncbi:MAG: T9SS type A sorting domain-containing protein [Prevotella sp.]|nr:T9SS type A sorting domain-containing protein [Prevotella sp.]
MRNNRIYSLIITLLLTVLGLQAQESNKLYIPDVSVEAGKQFLLPVCVENTNQEITALQFTLTLPEGVTVSSDAAVMTERTTGHKLTKHQDSSTGWTLLLYAMANTAIKGNTGIVVNIPVMVADSVSEGSVKPLSMTKAVLSDSIGQNVLTDFSCGNINVMKTPDFVVTDVACDLATINPEDSINVTWKVKNTGSVPTNGGWSERVFLVTEDGDSRLLTTVYAPDIILANGEEVSRETGIRIARLPGADGKGNIKIELVPNADSGERDANKGNNTAESEKNVITVNKLLYVTMPERMTEPDTETKLKVTVERSGSWQRELALALTKEGDARVMIPEQCVIPQNSSASSFYLTVLPDEVINDDSVFTIKVTADGYESVSRNLTLLDDELPLLTVTGDKRELREGEKMQMTITTLRKQEAPLVVSLSSDQPTHLSHPSTVTIDAGSNSVSFEAEVVQDTEITDTIAASLRATAEGYAEGEFLFLIVDDDMPQLELELKPTTTGEGDGVSAIVGKLVRQGDATQKLTVYLSDDSGGGLYYSQNKLEMGPGVSEVEFSMGAVDNDVVEGTRQYTVTAAVYIESCGCTAKSGSAGTVTATITVTDDDGLALKVKSTATSFKEGGEYVLTVTHNTSSEDDVRICLSSDADDMLEYDHEVTIRAGQKEAEVTVKVKENDALDDDRTVVFTVESEGYASSSCWVKLTDQTLPDVTITSLAVSPETAEVGSNATATVTLRNSGMAPLPPLTRVNLYLDGSNTALAHDFTDKALAVGDELTVSINFVLPAVPGGHYLRAVVNEYRDVKELTYTNNGSSRQEFTTEPPFTASLTASEAAYKQGEVVNVSGTITGGGVAGRDVEVYFISNGLRQTVTAVTDADGRFTATFKPQAGHYVAGACFPTEDLTREMASFDVYGVRTYAFDNEGSRIYEAFDQWELGDTYSGSFRVENLAGLPQTGLKVKQDAVSANCAFSFDVPESIEADGSVDIGYTITPSAISDTTDWQMMPLTVTTNEGSEARFTINYFVHSRKALLKSSVAHINTTMTVDAARDYPIVISNRGRGETGRITFSLPEWMKTVTPAETGSLAQGDSATVILRFCPTDAMQLNIPVEGNFGINPEHGDGISISFAVTPVSENKGTLTVDVVDEYTFNTEEKPHVTGATVRVKHPTTETVIETGTTDGDGKLSLTLPEGQYRIEVTAEGHEADIRQVTIDPERENKQEVMLWCNDVTYSFNVVETEIEDYYEIETVAKYDVRVPKPVILVSLPDERPTDGSIIPITVTNKGYINAINVDVSLASSGNYDIEFLNEPRLDVLAANQTEVFYARLTARAAESRRYAEDKPNSYECEALGAKVMGDIICGDIYNSHVTGEDYKAWGQCFGSTGGWGGFSWRSIGGGGGGGGGGRPTVDGDKKKDNDWWQRMPDYDVRKEFCDKRFPYDPGNPGNVNAPNDPINLPIVSPDEPDKQPCGSKEEPVLVYKLVPVSGTRYELKGVAADGASRVKIVLDPKASTIPEDDCGNITDIKWELSRDLGTIEGSSLREAIYTAPDSFPYRMGAVATVEAIVRYTQQTSAYESWGRHASVKIEIIRPPVVFLHGLGDSQKCWKEMDDMLLDESRHGSSLNTALYLDSVNTYRADYEKTNTKAFHVNVPVVYSSILKSQRRALAKGYVAAKCDLVGHSMGGILARLYLQDGGDKNLVNRLITVNTPHAGSEIGDAVWAHNGLVGRIASMFFKGISFNSIFVENLNAVRDLAVESDAMAHLNSVVGSVSGIDVPVYALATETKLTMPVVFGVGKGLDLASDGLMKSPNPLTIALGVLCKYFAHFVNDDVSQVGAGDLVVSTASQLGGCDASQTLDDGITGGPWHINSPKDPKVMVQLKELLTNPGKSDKFSTNWFAPDKRSFDHESWLLNLAGDKIAGMVGDKLWDELPMEKPMVRFLDEKGNQVGEVPLKEIVDEVVEEAKTMLGDVKVIGNTLSKSRALLPEETESQGRMIQLRLNHIEGYDDPFVIIRFGEGDAATFEGYDVDCPIPATFCGNVQFSICLNHENEQIVYANGYLTIETPEATPLSIRAEETCVDVGEEESLRLLCTWDNGEETFVDADNMAFETEGVAKYADQMITGVSRGYTEAVVSYAGLTCRTVVRVFGTGDTSSDDDEDDEESDNVCSTVSLSFKQEMVMTRQAFRGTLTVNNGHAAQALQNVKVNLEVRDEEGRMYTSREFEIVPEKLEGFEGELSFDAGWTLGAKESGTATMLFIPTKYAAETAPKKWSFGGTFSYTDAKTGLTVTNTLIPVTLTVNPTPNLRMDYFMQRDVLGDDPLTEDIVEPSVPAEFSLLISNIGYGDAANVRMVTGQPEIVDNEKGLLIDFELLSSQLNGGDKTLALGESVATDFGTIPAGKTSYAQWWFKSSLLGHFSEYDVKATHLTSYDNPDLSLLDTVVVHELIHTVTIPTEEEVPQKGFLVNDQRDSHDLPDVIYLTDGTSQEVGQAAATIKDEGNNEYTLTVTAMREGWFCGSIADPTAGRKTLKGIVRQSDGAELCIDYFWQTSCTLRDGKDPLYESRLHFADDIASSHEVYTLLFEANSTAELVIDSFDSAIGADDVANLPLEEIVVSFNKDVAASTFTSNDIRLTCDGVELDASKVVITKVGDGQFVLDLTAVTQTPGYYVLTINVAGISDTEGLTGESGRSIMWTQHFGYVTNVLEPSGRFTIMPNPLKEVLCIRGDTDHIRLVRVMSLSGSTVIDSIQYDDAGIDVSRLAAGLYIVAVITDDGAVYCKKVLKVK